MNRLGGLQCELQGGDGPIRVSHHVEAIDAKLLHEKQCVLCLLLDREGPGMSDAAAEPSAVVADQAEVISQLGLS